MSFGYGDQPLVEEVDLSIAPGEHVVILGPNGAGKSTIASLILGLYHPSSGELLADGIPYDVLDIRTLRRVGVVLQDPVILPGTVTESIAYGRPEAAFEDMSGPHVAGVTDFVGVLPADTRPALDRRVRCSPGPAPGIAIARALLGSPMLLILDEPTTHLDDAAIARLRTGLADLPRRPTVITITHDEALAGQADRTVRLKDGRTTGPELESVVRFPA